jgi:hypothetical protein
VVEAAELLDGRRRDDCYAAPQLVVQRDEREGCGAGSDAFGEVHCARR